MMTIEELRALRLKLGISLLDVARNIGFSRTYVNYRENYIYEATPDFLEKYEAFLKEQQPKVEAQRQQQRIELEKSIEKQQQVKLKKSTEKQQKKLLERLQLQQQEQQAQFSFSQLKPCPFCGEVKEINYVLDNKRENFYIFCNSCHSRGPEKKTCSEAFLAWNSAWRKGANDGI